MSGLNKVLGMIAVGKMISSTDSLFQRLLSGVAALVGLALLTALLVGTLVVGGIYFAYQALVANGLDPQAAFFTVGGIVAVLIAVLIAVTVTYVRRLRVLPNQIMQMESPLTYRASSIADAFMDGFLTHPKR